MDLATEGDTCGIAEVMISAAEQQLITCPITSLSTTKMTTGGTTAGEITTEMKTASKKATAVETTTGETTAVETTTDVEIATRKATAGETTGTSTSPSNVSRTSDQPTGTGSRLVVVYIIATFNTCCILYKINMRQ